MGGETAGLLSCITATGSDRILAIRNPDTSLNVPRESDLERIPLSHSDLSHLNHDQELES